MDLSRVGRSSCAPTRDGLPASPGLPVASRAQCQMGRLPAFNCAGTLLAVPPAAAGPHALYETGHEAEHLDGIWLRYLVIPVAAGHA